LIAGTIASGECNKKFLLLCKHCSICKPRVPFFLRQQQHCEDAVDRAFCSNSRPAEVCSANCSGTQLHYVDFATAGESKFKKEHLCGTVSYRLLQLEALPLILIDFFSVTIVSLRALSSPWDAWYLSDNHSNLFFSN
jgi:hypothetical protein